MKKSLAILSALAIALSLTACGGETDGSGRTDSSSGTESSIGADSTAGTESSIGADSAAETESSIGADSDAGTESSEKSSGADNTESEPSAPAQSEPKSDSGLIRPEVKEAIDSYEAFVDEYVEFMKKFNSSSNQAQLMMEYLDYISKLADFEKKIDELDDKELTEAETLYYSEVLLRCSQKLLKAAA